MLYPTDAFLTKKWPIGYPWLVVWSRYKSSLFFTLSRNFPPIIKQNFLFHDHEIQSLVPVLGHINQLHKFIHLFFCTFHFNRIIPSVFSSEVDRHSFVLKYVFMALCYTQITVVNLTATHVQAAPKTPKRLCPLSFANISNIKALLLAECCVYAQRGSNTLVSLLKPKLYWGYKKESSWKVTLQISLKHTTVHVSAVSPSRRLKHSVYSNAGSHNQV